MKENTSGGRAKRTNKTKNTENIFRAVLFSNWCVDDVRVKLLLHFLKVELNAEAGGISVLCDVYINTDPHSYELCISIELVDDADVVPSVCTQQKHRM